MGDWLDYILHVDASLLILINAAGSPAVGDFFWYVTKTITWSPMFLALFLCILRGRSWQRIVLALVLLALLITVADQTASGLCKPLFQRLRPSHEPTLQTLFVPIHDYRGGLYGFFSSHAANTFAAATFLSMLFRKRYIIFTLFSWAMLSSYSRMYLGVHYPTDILVGMMFGIVVGWLFYRLYSFLCKSVRYFRTFPDAPLHPKMGAMVSAVFVGTVVVLMIIAAI